MRLAIRFKQHAEKLDHLAQKNINKGLQSTQGSSDEAENKFELEYLISHNTKIIKTVFRPQSTQTEELIQHVSKLVGISSEYLMLRITNKFFIAEKNKLLQKEKNKPNSGLNQGEVCLKKQSNIFGGIDFAEQNISKVKLIKGFDLSKYNINNVIHKKTELPKQSIEKKQEENSNVPIQMKTLQIQVEIVAAYYVSEQYKKVLKQNRASKVNQLKGRMALNHNKEIENLSGGGIIKQEDEDQEEDQVEEQVEEQTKKKPNRPPKMPKFDTYKVDENQVSREIYDPSISSYRGQLMRVRTPPLSDHKFYYEIDPYEGLFKQYESKQKYPGNPHEIFSLNLLKEKNDVQRVQGKNMSWYMKKQLFYFSVEFTSSKNKKQKYKFSCNFSETVDKWIEAFHSGLQKWNQIKLTPMILLDLVRNDKPILDRIQVSPVKKPSNSTKYIEAFENTFAKEAEDKEEIDKDILRQSFASQSESCLKGIQSSAPAKKKQEKEQSKKSQTRTSSTSAQQSIQDTKQEEEEKEKGLKLKHFKMIKELGQGSFGQVFLASHFKNKQLYALKVFKKKKLVLMKQIKFAIAQINILKQINNPFVISLHFTFQTPNYIYLGLDYCGGKDLSHHLIQQINFIETDCRFYAAELVLALQYLHSLGIIYRDLKPQNVLLDTDGHLKIIDFGLSKQTENNFAKSFCGSPAYISPQMLKKNGVGKQCDYFSLGAVIYQMLVGQPPFYSEDIKVLYENISNAKLKFPKIVSEKARSLLEGLLRKNPKNRLGSNGFDEIKNHDFFKGIDWAKVYKKQYEAPKRLIIESMDIKDEQDPETELLKIFHEDFDYNETNLRINRFKNFSFIREGQFQ